MELPYLKTSRHYRIGSHGHLQTVRNSMTTYVRGRWGARAAGRSARTWWKAKHLNVAVSVIKSDDKNKLSPPRRGGARCFFPQAHVLPNSRGRRIGDVLREWRTLRDVLYAPSVRTLYVSVSKSKKKRSSYVVYTLEIGPIMYKIHGKNWELGGSLTGFV